MIVVTGAAGFVGSVIVQQLNARGIDDLLLVDRQGLFDSRINPALKDIKARAAMTPEEFRHGVCNDNLLDEVTAVCHQGAITDTMATDTREVLDNNTVATCELMEWCAARGVRLVYASSASVYGDSIYQGMWNICPLNLYAASTAMVDGHAKLCWRREPESEIIGLRYYNVYGANEGHKGRMASMVYQMYQQLHTTGVIKLFEDHPRLPGPYARDFISVNEVARLNVHMLLDYAGTARWVWDVGTGEETTFDDMAEAIIEHADGAGKIERIPFPDALVSAYQAFTHANPMNTLSSFEFADPDLELQAVLEQMKTETSWGS
jgi:ADP-L-glycero-D-manno-heptose 6-epimerase